MIKVVVLCLIAVTLPSVIGQTTPSSDDPSTHSVDDIYSLDEEDFKLWITGRTPKSWETSTRRSSSTTQSSLWDDNHSTEQIDSLQPITIPKEELFTETSTRRSSSTTQRSLWDDNLSTEQIDSLQPITIPKEELFTETNTRRSSSTTQSSLWDDNHSTEQIDSHQPITIPKEELLTEPAPSNETRQQTDEKYETEGYVYPRPENLQDWLQSNMLQSQQINNQLLASVNTQSQPSRNVGSAPGCVTAGQPFSFRPLSASFQTLATIHRFSDNSPPQQQLPFPGSSHHGDQFLNQNQHQQKPQQQQPEPEKAQVHSPPQLQLMQPSFTYAGQQGQQITTFYGSPLFYHPQQVTYSPAVQPLEYGYY
ncbi:uncharacterized protein LOC134214717 [Armigeres subalbatus]|uniref:uncharacterized protein LOC134214717 n=1 Tax=Armigeres subalbatus TaxID=124917 RepID=UPI002ED47076